MRFLSTCDVLARAGHDDNRNVIVVASQETLSACHDVAYDDGRAEREDDVLVVRVQHTAAVHLALETNNCLQLEIL